MPVSAVLADDRVMLTIKPGEHGSTYGGNPLACAVARTALEILVDEDLAGNATRQGERMLSAMQGLVGRYPLVESVRGRGLLLAMVVKQGVDLERDVAWELCLKLAENGTSGLVVVYPIPMSPFVAASTFVKCCVLDLIIRCDNRRSLGEADAWEHHSLLASPGHKRQTGRRGARYHRAVGSCCSTIGLSVASLFSSKLISIYHLTSHHLFSNYFCYSQLVRSSHAKNVL